MRIAESEKVKVFDFWSINSETHIPKSEVKYPAAELGGILAYFDKGVIHIEGLQSG